MSYLKNKLTYEELEEVFFDMQYTLIEKQERIMCLESDVQQLEKEIDDLKSTKD